jgi:hypothetical protein
VIAILGKELQLSERNSVSQEPEMKERRRSEKEDKDDHEIPARRSSQSKRGEQYPGFDDIDFFHFEDDPLFSSNEAPCANTSILRVIQYRDCIQLEVVMGCESSRGYVMSPRKRVRDCPDQSQTMPDEISFSFHL